MDWTAYVIPSNNGSEFIVGDVPGIDLKESSSVLIASLLSLEPTLW